MMHVIAIVLAVSATGPATTRGVETTGSPKEGYVAYNDAMAKGDVEGMVALEHAVTPGDQRLARLCAKSDAAVGALEEATKEKFGDAARVKLAAALNDLTNDDVGPAKVEVHGDRATITTANGSHTAMVYAGGKWKIDVAGTMKADGDEDGDHEAATFVSRMQVTRHLLQALNADEFKTADELVAAAKKKIAE